MGQGPFDLLSNRAQTGEVPNFETYPNGCLFFGTPPPKRVVLLSLPSFTFFSLLLASCTFPQHSCFRYFPLASVIDSLAFFSFL